jgi:hypothetical protein
MSVSDRRETLGMRVITDIVINRCGINYDDIMLARTCRNCGRLMLNVKSIDIEGNSNFRLVIYTDDDVPTTMRGAELLSATCQCGAVYDIILFDPVTYAGSGIVAYTIIQLDEMDERMTDRYMEMKKHGYDPDWMDEWTACELANGFNGAVKIVNEKGVSLVEEDWNESKYSTGWVEK